MTSKVVMKYKSGKNYILPKHSSVFMVEICYDRDCGTSKTIFKCMLEREFRALESGGEKFECDFVLVYGTMIAMFLTPKQVIEKFIGLADSWSILAEIAFELGYLKPMNSTIGGPARVREVHRELQVEKYNPRSVIGRLDFDRRAEADGIVFND